MKARGLDAALVDIQKIVEYGVHMDEERKRWPNSGLNPGKDDEVRAELDKSVEKSRRWCRELLCELIAFPPQYCRREQQVDSDERRSRLVRSRSRDQPVRRDLHRHQCEAS